MKQLFAKMFQFVNKIGQDITNKDKYVHLEKQPCTICSSLVLVQLKSRFSSNMCKKAHVCARDQHIVVRRAERP